VTASPAEEINAGTYLGALGQSALDRLDALQRAALTRLLDGPSDGERELLAQLVETSCLLELAKIDASRFDPASYLQQALDALVALFPVGGASIVLELDWWPKVELSAGRRVDARRSPWRSAITLDGHDVGVIGLGDPIVRVDVVGFVASAATQLSAGLGACVEAERRRRGSAVATAMRIASELEASDPISTLEAVAEQLAAFAGTVSAELIVDHPVVGAPLTARAGIASPATRSRVTTREVDGGLLIVKRHGPAVSDDEPTDMLVAAVLEQLDLSLSRIDRTQRLEREVETDPLTGLGNRRRLERVLASALSRAQRYGERVAFLVMDVDGFKAVNDTLGHDVGDLVLRACARSLQHVTRGYDEIVRLGGDEIAVLSAGSDIVAATKLAEEIRTAVPIAAAAVLPPGLELSVSIGVAAFPDSAVDADGLVKAADAALIAAKNRGKNVVLVAPPGRHHAPGDERESVDTSEAARRRGWGRRVRRR
jgi:diguanylate cyclase (GGDEF)-like protein